MTRDNFNRSPPSFLRERLHIVIACILIVIGSVVLVSAFVVFYLDSNSYILHSFHANKEISDDSIFLVGISQDDIPPFITYNNGVPTGLDIDIITWIANNAKINIQFVPLATFDDCFNALKNGEIDMFISGVTITRRRSEEFLFSDPYLSTDQQIAVANESSLTLNDFYLSDKIIGVHAGTSSCDLLKSLFIEPQRVEEINGILNVVKKLTDGELDFIVTKHRTMIVLDQPYPLKVIGSIFTGEKYGIAFQKDSVALQKMTNVCLKQLLRSPEWKEMQLKYYPTQASQI